MPLDACYYYFFKMENTKILINFISYLKNKNSRIFGMVGKKSK